MQGIRERLQWTAVVLQFVSMPLIFIEILLRDLFPDPTACYCRASNQVCAERQRVPRLSALNQTRSASLIRS